MSKIASKDTKDAENESYFSTHLLLLNIKSNHSNKQSSKVNSLALLDNNNNANKRNTSTIKVARRVSYNSGRSSFIFDDNLSIMDEEDDDDFINNMLMKPPTQRQIERNQDQLSLSGSSTITSKSMKKINKEIPIMYFQL